MGATEDVSRWIIQTKYGDLPTDVLDAARISCFDCVGVILAGASEPLGDILTDYIAEASDKPEAAVLGTNLRTSAPSAALVNGTLAHAMDFDNAGGFGHPAAVLF